MKSVILGLVATLVLAGGSNAGIPARGKICRYNPRVATPAGGEKCAVSEFMTDGAMGGSDYARPYDHAEVITTAPPPYVSPGCEGGREFQVYVRLDGYATWIFPRFLDCPD